MSEHTERYTIFAVQRKYKDDDYWYDYDVHLDIKDAKTFVAIYRENYKEYEHRIVKREEVTITTITEEAIENED